MEGDKEMDGGRWREGHGGEFQGIERSGGGVEKNVLWIEVKNESFKRECI
jgi:hypothetical protein